MLCAEMKACYSSSGLGPRSQRAGFPRDLPMRIAVVIPAFNEAGNIGRLIEETIAAVPEANLQEVIVVDDASDDGTDAEIKAMLSRCKRLRYLRHGTRAGQSAALRNGVIAAAAPVIATMDGDGQNDPADIMRLVSRLGREGREPALVGGLREGRKAKDSRRAASRFANWIRDKVLADGRPDTGPQHLFHLARQAGSEHGECGVTGAPRP